MSVNPPPLFNHDVYSEVYSVFYILYSDFFSDKL